MNQRSDDKVLIPVILLAAVLSLVIPSVNVDAQLYDDNGNEIIEYEQDENGEITSYTVEPSSNDNNDDNSNNDNNNKDDNDKSETNSKDNDPCDYNGRDVCDKDRKGCDNHNFDCLTDLEDGNYCTTGCVQEMIRKVVAATIMIITKVVIMTIIVMVPIQISV